MNIEDDETLLLPATCALSSLELAPVREAIHLPAEQFGKAVAPAMRKLLIQGLANMPEPTSIKELTAVAKLQRLYDEMDRKESNSLPQGLVSFLRPVGRRVIDVGDEVDPFAV